MKACTVLLAVLCAGTLASASYVRGNDRFRRMKDAFSNARRFGGVDGFTRFRTGGGSRVRRISSDFSNQGFGHDSLRSPTADFGYTKNNIGRFSRSRRGPNRLRSSFRSGFNSPSISFRPSIGKIDTIGKDSDYESMPGSFNFQRQGFLSGINFVKRPEAKRVGRGYGYRSNNPSGSFRQDSGNGNKFAADFARSNVKIGTTDGFGHESRFGTMSGDFAHDGMLGDFGHSSKSREFGHGSKSRGLFRPRNGYKPAKPAKPGTHFGRTFRRSGLKISEISRASFHPRVPARGRSRYPSPVFGKH